MADKIKLKEKVNLSIIDCKSYGLPNVKEFKDKYPDWKKNNAAIYLNNYRVHGPKDYNTEWIYDNFRTGKSGIEVKEILIALGIPAEFIEEHFEFDK